MRATIPATPTRRTSSGPGTSRLGSVEAAMTSMRSPASTSLTSRIERSWPTASGVTVSGNGTISRRGSTGRAAGSSAAAAPLPGAVAPAGPPSGEVTSTVTAARPPAGRRWPVRAAHRVSPPAAGRAASIGTGRPRSVGRATGISIRRMPSW